MRAENRHHRRRKIAAMKRWLEREYHWLKNAQHDKLLAHFCGRFDLPKLASKRAITPKPCSGGAHGVCKNPRKRGEGDPYRDKRKTGNYFDET